MLNHNYYIILIAILCNTLKLCEGIWCYRCTSATPGCAEDFNWRGIGYWGEQCPEDNDICVKINEKRNGEEFITRDCLSALSFRSDIPADRYEGCRHSAKDIRLANYVNHSIKEHDVKRDYYPDTLFCFCFLDHRCNTGNIVNFTSNSLILSMTIIAIINTIHHLL